MLDPRIVAGKLARELRAKFGDELWSVVLFGSVPRGEAIPGISDLNVLVLLESIGASQLANAAPLVQQWIRGGNSPPHLYSWDEWLGMQDTFAIEIADMQDAREILLGTDPITQDVVRLGDLRLHAEREARETLLNLRLRMMLSADNPLELGSLLMSGLPSFTAYMRAALRVSDEAPGVETRSVIERTARRIDADPQPLLATWEARCNVQPFKVQITDPIAEGYTDFVHSLMQYLDHLGGSITKTVVPSPSAAAAH
ncbi:MAG: hypothetical protein WEE89_07490 [Gemmatimonadota bacterium]